MSRLDAADFLAYLDEAIEQGIIGNQERKLLLKDMPAILDSIYYGRRTEKTISIRSGVGAGNFFELKLPGYVRTYYNHKLSTEVWYKNNDFKELHREGDKPAYISYDENGKLDIEEWRYKGVRNREDDKPSYIMYGHNNQPNIEEWAQGGIRQRNSDKPSYIEYYENGKVYLEQWYRKGEIHRDGGKPARIIYDQQGEIAEEEFWVTGSRVQRRN